jgi:hypothetical protein
MAITVADVEPEQPTLDSIEAELALIRLQCDTFITVEGMQHRDGRPATRVEVVDLNLAMARFAFLVRAADRLRHVGAFAT